MKKAIKNLHKKIDGSVMIVNNFFPIKLQLDVIITNDELGKTLTIGDGSIAFTFPFEEIERYLK